MLRSGGTKWTTVAKIVNARHVRVLAAAAVSRPNTIPAIDVSPGEWLRLDPSDRFQRHVPWHEKELLQPAQ